MTQTQNDAPVREIAASEHTGAPGGTRGERAAQHSARGVPRDVRVCQRCKRPRPLDGYAAYAWGRDGLYAICEECRGRMPAAQAKYPTVKCVLCQRPIPKERLKHFDTCSRECLCLSVGVDPELDMRSLGRATEQEIREVLESIILAASAGCRA